MGTCVHFSRSLPSNSWWQTMVGWQVLSRPSAAEGGGRRPAFTGLAIQPCSATEVDGWQHKLSRVSQNRAAVHYDAHHTGGPPGTTGAPLTTAEDWHEAHNLAAAFDNIIRVQASRTICAGIEFALYKSVHLESAETAEHQEPSKRKLRPPVGRSAGVPVQRPTSGRSDDRAGSVDAVRAARPGASSRCRSGRTGGRLPVGSGTGTGEA